MPDVDFEKLFRTGRLQVDSPENHDHREHAVRLLRFYKRDEKHPDYGNYVNLRAKYPTISEEEIETATAITLGLPPPPVQDVICERCAGTGYVKPEVKVVAPDVVEKKVKKSKKVPSKK